MADPIPLRPRRPCPICKRQSVQKFHPFCSNRCAQIDLGKWLGEKYSVPAEEQDLPSEESGDGRDEN